ncbi:thiamine-phosphate pyrophosphorylase [Lachnospiraceae bacterium XBB1006]|nr:thiamine-phosphate pyrophosphorylase [Lachnospiraceae bacterium XBB1006]
MRRETLRLYAITDPKYAVHVSMKDVVRSALEGGVTMIQLREKNCSQEAFLQKAKEICALCHAYQVPLIINDNWQVALDSGADGVHLGQSDLPEDIRFLKEKKLWVGITAKTVEQAQRAEAMGADYIGVGALFGSPTKQDAKRITFSECKEICESVSIPAVGIGGITKDNLRELEGIPLAGVALVSAVFGAEDIRNSSRELRRLTEEIFT